ncbi:hypothetical protein EON79_20225 [bacterium]|nr:MAG: hypothetical protein EON79_20225 [bacterium]
MSWLNDFQAEMRSVVDATWPQVEGRIYDSVQTARQNLLQAITKGGPSGVELPLAVVQFARASRDDAHGLHNRSYRVPTTILLLTEVSDTAASDAQDLMDALQLAIERAPHDSFQAIEDGEPDAQETNAALSALNEARMNVHAVLLSYQPGLLAGDYAL